MTHNLKKGPYQELNDAINGVFFDGRYQGLPVYLDLEENEISEIAQGLDENPDELELLLGLTVTETLCWQDTNIYRYHDDNLVNWHNNNFDEPPPFTALLLALSSAAEHMHSDGEYSSNNYYQRLAEVFNVSDPMLVDKIRSQGKNTLIFWKALNLWLTDNDYAYGKPTARKVNSWTYVSLAISQSLVRDVDRKKFHNMFMHYGISSNDNLGESEILLYMHEWMVSSDPSSWLKKLWSIPDLRERVVTAAINELESWDGGGGFVPEGEQLNKRLGWLIIVKSVPRQHHVDQIA